PHDNPKVAQEGPLTMVSNTIEFEDAGTSGRPQAGQGRRTWSNLAAALRPEKPAPDDEPCDRESAPFPGPPSRAEIKVPVRGQAPLLKQPAPVVRQAELARYQELRERAREFEALRKEILTRLGEGAAVEPGALSAAVRQYSQKLVTQAVLLEALGED